MSFILQCGHDALLLTTRELILKQDGFRVFNASDPIEAVRILSQKKIDLVLLCHTLSEHEFRAILANARLLPDAPKVLSLIPNTYPSFAPSAKIEIFNSLNGPGTLLAAVHGLLGNDGSTPQPHHPSHGATHAETHQHREMV